MLGAAVVRTMAEADSLARVIDDAFEPDDPDGAAAERQLSGLLDEWWRAENQEGRAVIDDANARAAMRRHVAGIEASEIIADSYSDADIGDALIGDADIGDGAMFQQHASAMPSPAPAHLPEQMLAALDTADPAGLQSLLAALAASLDVRPVGSVRMETATRMEAATRMETVARTETATSPVSTARSVHDLVIRPECVEATGHSTTTSPDEVFRTFWVKGSTPSVDTVGWGWIPIHVVLPMMAVTSALALVLAWIG